MMKKYLLLAFLLSAGVSQSIMASPSDSELARHYLHVITTDKTMGMREAGSINEKNTARYILAELAKHIDDVKTQTFKFKIENTEYSSSNIIANLPGRTDKTLVLAAHYDSTEAAKGSQGAIDNGTGVAALLVIARKLARLGKLDYSIRFIAFGAEEVGLNGSRHYVSQLSKDETKKIMGMINFDSISGGDVLYVHSAHSKPYSCDQGNYSAGVEIREGLLAASITATQGLAPYKIHPKTNRFPAGQTGPWSDHAAFACAGIPIAYVEATNFVINGKEGNDGYSQSTHSHLWDCFDKAENTACERKKESQWGQIWHTGNDRLDRMQDLFPGRLYRQMDDNIKIVVEFLKEAKHYLQR